MTKFMIRIIIFRRYKYLLSRYLLSTAPTSVIGEENRGVKVRIKLSRYSLGKRKFRIIAIFCFVFHKGQPFFVLMKLSLMFHVLELLYFSLFIRLWPVYSKL